MFTFFLSISSLFEIELNISTGVQRFSRSDIEMSTWINVFQSFLDFCKKRKIPVVVAAGNKPGVEYAHDSYPQALSQPDDTMIIVGGVTQTGALYTTTVQDPDGCIAVYAPAENIAVPKPGGAIPGVVEQAGTSHAAAIVVRKQSYKFP